jgi:hypothetical protein
LAGAIIMISLQMVRQTRAEPGLRMVWVPASAISPLSTARKRALKLRHRIVKAVSCAARPAQDDGTDGMTAGVISLTLRSQASGVREHRRGAGRANKAAELEQAGAEAHARTSRLLQRLVRQPVPNLVEQKIVDGPSGHGMPRVRGKKGSMRLS